MTQEEPSIAEITPFSLVRENDTEAAALAAIIRRLASARSLAEIMAIVTHAARTLLQADGVTFVLRDGQLCHYAEEDAIGPLWKGNASLLVPAFPAGAWSTSGLSLFPI
jgi:GAF domain-containing protein